MYCKFENFVEQNKGKLFLDGFEVVELHSFIISNMDEEPCYVVIRVKTPPLEFYAEEYPCLLELYPIENLPEYDRIYGQWIANKQVVDYVVDFSMI